MVPKGGMMGSRIRSFVVVVHAQRKVSFGEVFKPANHICSDGLLTSVEYEPLISVAHGPP